MGHFWAQNAHFKNALKDFFKILYKVETYKGKTNGSFDFFWKILILPKWVIFGSKFSIFALFQQFQKFLELSKVLVKVQKLYGETQFNLSI